MNEKAFKVIAFLRARAAKKVKLKDFKVMLSSIKFSSETVTPCHKNVTIC